MHAVITWLDTHSSAVAAAGTIAGVVVATIYSYFTWHLWKAAREQHWLTYDIFKHSHRPYLAILPSLSASVTEGRRFLNLKLTNVSDVPAVVKWWHLELYRGTEFLLQSQATGRDTGLLLHSRESGDLQPVDLASADIEQHGRRVWMKFSLSYVGPYDRMLSALLIADIVDQEINARTYDISQKEFIVYPWRERRSPPTVLDEAAAREILRRFHGDVTIKLGGG